MLKTLTVKNIALIDNAVIDFSSGLNIMTGETGAGKSLIINSLGILKGNRSSRELIRTGEESAMVSGIFEINREIKDKIYEITGIECDDDEIIIQRQISADGKNSIRINGVPVILSMLKEVGEQLVNIHSQHDGTILLNKNSHPEFLDDFIGDKITGVKKEYAEIFDLWNDVKEELNNIVTNEAERERRLDMLRYQADEICSANIKCGEDDDLEERRNLLANSRKVVDACLRSYGALYESSMDESSAYDMLFDAIKLIEGVSEYDKALAESLNELTDAAYAIKENARIIKDFSDNLSFDEGELQNIEDRLDTLNTLKKKYGPTLEDVMKFYDDISKELDDIESSDERREELCNKEKELSVKVHDLAKKLTQIRCKHSEVLSDMIAKELSDLEMPQVKFGVNITDKELSKSGKDNIEFMICTNVGEGMKPLSKIASGGELSRIILAIKNVLAKEKNAETLIFDEVDTGVSGKVAQRIGEKLYSMSRYSQVISITHLPQIAAFGDVHFMISKGVEGSRTVTDIHKLSGEESVSEMARLLGGESITDITRENARELISSADNTKEKYR